MDNNNSTGFDWPIRVYYEDTDSGGVVYYANYLKFMERARTEWLRSLGFEQDELIATKNVLFAVRSVQVDYLKPARFNQALVVKSTIKQLGRASLTFEQTILNQDQEVLCAGLVKIASLTADEMRPVAIPQEMMQRLKGEGSDS
jgi:acyl-CoA thioester hydrolase